MAHRQLGDLQIMRALEMLFTFDADAMFPDVTREQWAPYLDWITPQGYDPETHKLIMPVQSYIVRTPHHTILVDACAGNHKNRPGRPYWHMKSDNTYLKALANNGLCVEDIDFVMCTHLHSDHVGWNTRLQDGRWVPTFPNARYVFTENELVAWRDIGNEKFPRNPIEDSVLPIVEAGRADLVKNDFALDDHVWLEPTPGHTPDHVAIHFNSGNARAVMCGDLIHTPVQCAHPEWEAWPDWDSKRGCATRRAFLDRYCDTDTLICPAHFPLPSSGRIVSWNDAYRFEVDDQRC